VTRLAPELDERNETELERCDRHLAELMQEIRVAQTGVQVLFGFLLTVPFSTRFPTLGTREHALYFATLVAAGIAVMLLIAPGAQHRMLFRCGDKQHIVRMAHRYAIAGFGCVALAMIGALLLVGDVVFGSALGMAAAVTAGGGALWCWYLQPLLRRRSLFRRRAPRIAPGSRELAR
jgi:hypothetical protein